MTVKKYLEQARQLDMEIERKVSRLRDLYALVTKTAPARSAPPGERRDPHSPEERMERVLALREEVNTEIDRLVELKKAIYAAIDALPEERYRSVVEKHYLEGMTYEEIGRELGYHPNAVYRILRRALASMKCPGQEE